MLTIISTRVFLLLSGLTLSPSLLVFGQLFVYPPPNKCTTCTIPFNLDLPECESPYLSDCYCQNWTPHIGAGYLSGTYITPILSCARSHCTTDEVDELTNYYDGLCGRNSEIEDKEVISFDSLLTIDKEDEQQQEQEQEIIIDQNHLSKSCSTCITSFITNTLNQCTTKDLSRCMCSSDIFLDGEQFSKDCPCASEAEKKASLLDSRDIVASPSLRLLACLRGPSCSGRDKSLLARWGEKTCLAEVFTGEAVYRDEWEEDKEKNGKKGESRSWWGMKSQIVERDRMGSMSSWGADDHHQRSAGGKVAVRPSLWSICVGISGLVIMHTMGHL